MEENITNEQMYMFLKMILEIVKSSETKEDAIKKIEELINHNWLWYYLRTLLLD